MSALPLRSRPLSQYILKVHSRCDLACDHCYVYEHADQSWRDRPQVMAQRTVRQAAARIAEHAATHGLRTVRVILHGGEPLLMGLGGLRAALAELRTTIEPVAAVDLRLQTNGVLLSAETCDLFLEYGVRVGVSLDGDRAANDRHRRFANGASSHAQVRRALALLRRPEYRRVYAGLLCTIDLANDPIEVYEALLAEAPPRIDLLLPHATWERPPPRPDGDPAPYAGWLLRIHRRWLADGRPVPIRLFDSLLSTAAGGPSRTEAMGLDPSDLVVIETDGAWERPDWLKVAFEGAAATGLDVFRHAVDEAAAQVGEAGRWGGVAALCATCRACPVVRRCGGGLYAHRYRRDTGFANPSVYCADLKELIVATTPAPDRGSTDWLVDDLGAGYGSPAAVRFLVEAELGVVRALLVALADGIDEPVAADGWALLGRLDRERPEATRTVLSHPYLRRWATRCLRAIRRGEPVDRGYLACVAAAAAVRAGVGVALAVPVRSGAAYLPTAGTFRPHQPSGGSATLSITAGAVETGGGEWWPVRSARLDDDVDVAIDDLDPYRDCYRWPVAARLADGAAGTWTRGLGGAWRALRRDAPDQLAALRPVLRTVTPLEPAAQPRSATPRGAFGAVGVAQADEHTLAVLIAHEIQHSKLGALLDLTDLVHRGSVQRLPVGWRPDPRPAEGVLQGLYAHLAVADIWRSRSADPARWPGAAARYDRYRGWTVDAIRTLASSGALTGAGRRFVARLDDTARRWPS